MATKMEEIDDVKALLALAKPYAGLFENKSRRNVLFEMMSDPDEIYSQKDLKYLLQLSGTSIKDALSYFIETNMVKKCRDSQQPEFCINKDVKRFLALYILSLAINDDFHKTDFLDEFIFSYSFQIQDKFRVAEYFTKNSVFQTADGSMIMASTIEGATDDYIKLGRGQPV